MNRSTLIAAAALSVLAAAGAHAETYQGVQTLAAVHTRAEVHAQAVVAARSEDPYAEGASSQVAPQIAVTDRAAVRAAAVATAHAPNQNLYREAFVDSKVPAQYTAPRATTRQAGL